ncbi:hypothetical protein LTR56_011136 [Elasticomyces elasticus]|nr:hypothetical protein LTR56_011136 [Elasticomyces elasticus]KAK3662443.1 hypothetical protein LTR22_006722 [Elasticomyces elasticus]KAK4926432.1 hypothetical protein LTR49_006639 [Elasticomyces elasticus]KAK5761195.1 hypothetical protein LTS12_008676 [Elasticomyces elasticus]
MDDLVTALQSDRLIKLVIGTKPEAEAEADGSYGTLSIWASALEAAAEYFRGALRNQHLGEGSEPDVLIFPEDDFRAWKVLLYWMVKSELPEDDDMPKFTVSPMLTDGDYTALVLCWILGDKYGVPGFQDLIMIELILQLEIQETPMGIIRYCFVHTAPRSVLRELMAEELILCLGVGVLFVEDEDVLNEFGGIPGFSTTLAKKMMLGKEPGCYRGRLPFTSMKGSYQDFMIGKSLPKLHWYHDQVLSRLE